MRITLQLEREGDDVSGLLEDGFRRRDFLHNLKLSPASLVTVKGAGYRLADLVEALSRHHVADIERAFDQRGQLDQGRHLFQEVFRRRSRAADEELWGAGEVELRVVTSDEHLLRLPWVLLADPQGFLLQRGWSVTLAESVGASGCELPPEPRLLIAAPAPPGEPTGAEAHLAELRGVLSLGTSGYWERCVRTVTRWEDFRRAVAEHEHELVYYYGHGEGDLDDSALVFEGPDGRAQRVSMTRFASCLDTAPSRPLLVYLNCCSGDAGGVLGAGVQLRRFTSAVISNRTTVLVEAARVFARELWRRVLVDGAAPHAAAAGVHRHLHDHAELGGATEWMIPVIHASYDEWNSSPLSRPGTPGGAPYVLNRFDRTDQIDPFTRYTLHMLEQKRPPSHAYVWFGEPDHGADLFHDRIVGEIKALPGVARLSEVFPEWPMELVSPGRSFEHMCIGAFNLTRELSEVPERLKRLLPPSGRLGSRIVYVHHPLLDLTGPQPAVDPAAVARWLQWWDANITRFFTPPVFAILSIGFVVGDAESFERELRDVHRLDRLGLGSTPVQILPSLRDVTRKQIVDYLQYSGAGIPPDDCESIGERLLRETAGKYAAVHARLASVRGDYWALLPPTGGAAEPPVRSTSP